MEKSSLLSRDFKHKSDRMREISKLKDHGFANVSFIFCQHMANSKK